MFPNSNAAAMMNACMAPGRIGPYFGGLPQGKRRHFLQSRAVLGLASADTSTAPGQSWRDSDDAGSDFPVSTPLDFIHQGSNLSVTSLRAVELRPNGQRHRACRGIRLSEDQADDPAPHGWPPVSMNQVDALERPTSSVLTGKSNSAAP